MMAVEALTLGKYHYWDEHEEDNIKRFHFFAGSDGKDHHIDFSPYHRPSAAEQEAVREFVEITGKIPNRWDNNNGHNFLKGDIFTIRQGLCLCGDPDCNEQYEHWTGGY